MIEGAVVRKDAAAGGWSGRAGGVDEPTEYAGGQ